MRRNEAETIVGIPLYEEDAATVGATLSNIDCAVEELGLDAEVWLTVNGPRTACGKPPVISTDSLAINTPVKTFFSRERGQTAAIDEMVREAHNRKIGRMFITDADIYRFPDSLSLMWHSSDRPLVGAQYRPYPIEVVSDVYPDLTSEEKLLYEIFDGDQKPEVRQALRANGIDRLPRVKGSLMLLDVQDAIGMHQGSTAASDSAINLHFGPQHSEVVLDARFMHMGRLNMADHIMARARHYVGAVQRNDMQRFLAKQVKVPDVVQLTEIASELRDNHKNGKYFAALYLARCALRERVDEICQQIALERWENIPFGETGQITTPTLDTVESYDDAKHTIGLLLCGVDWDAVCGFSSELPPTTQVDTRVPIDMQKYMQDPTYGPIIDGSFVDGQDKQEELLSA